MTKISSLLLSAAALIAASSFVTGQSEGDIICVEGYIMDNFCIERGTLLDDSTARTLEEPEKHTVHCLVDVGVCTDSPFHVLEDGSPYGVGWQVDDNSQLISLARSVGTCNSCDGDGDLRAGFRAVVRGEVTDASRQLLSVQEVGLPGEDLCANICPLDVMQCGDEFFNRDPDNNCEFPPCVCPLDVQECTDGTVVSRVPPMCEFEDCPPTSAPTASPTESPTKSPTSPPTVAETPEPSPSPSASPTARPSPSPSVNPTFTGTDAPSFAPSPAPSVAGTDSPSASPSRTPSAMPSMSPSSSPSAAPSGNSPVPSASPSASPSSAPSSAPSLSPSVSPSASPSLAPSMNGTVEEPIISCSEYSEAMDVPGLEGVTLEYIVNMNPIIGEHNLTGNLTFLDGELPWYNNVTNETIFGPPIISVRVTYEGQAWLGFAVSQDGSMVGSSAVIGVPNATTGEGETGHYNLTFENGQGYDLFPNQTLMDAFITQDENYTILEFTRYLDEELYGLSIDGSGFNYFLVAYGMDNVLGYHGAGRSSFNLTLMSCNLYEFDDMDNINGTTVDLEEAVDENGAAVVNRDGDTDIDIARADPGTLQSTSSSAIVSTTFGLLVGLALVALNL
ncbi:Similarities with uniprot P08640 Saccharomyces cerevisiae YIR019c STA1 [Seminavis robusta]|uniref:Circumsporozoite protein n=1 Tax=Seminavis robusta TaxID=568900 RepID=A0A9N8ELL6_9STRA|nr:Similarities with uniprot P08640 Saccharomyces cerevisiae YIR019c STA1 [Seminavis robusta]|eukprot:Sro1487_g276810.1 Similarities with uniprot P08640 Saccharomyces cerevisiae YIR019c STA1 (618) ;mRNA; f:21984-23837